MPRRASKKKIPKLKLTRPQELNALYRIMEISQSGHTLDSTLEMIAIDISMTTQFPLVAIEQYDAASQTLQVKAARGFESNPGIFSASKSVAGAVSTSAKMVHQVPVSDEFWKEKGAQTYYGFPLVAGKRCIGTLSFGHSEEVEMEANLEKWADGVASFLASFLQWNLATEAKPREKKAPQLPASPKAGQDELTQLPNAELFRFMLTQALSRSRRTKEMVAVLFIDLEGYRDFKANAGQEAANSIIKQVAERIRRNVREGDTVARWSEDQFIWLISSLQNMDNVAMVAEKMLAVIQRPVTVEEKTLTMTTSIGISLYPYDGGDTETLVKHSQTALVRAKELGTNMYHFYSEAINAKVFGQLNLKRQLREGLDRHEFVLHYQPVVKTDTGEIDAVEAFVRWQNPDGTLTYPSEFVLLSEDTGLIALLDQWVLKTACEQAARWESMISKPIRVSVNVSQRLFGQEDFVERVTEIIAQTGIRPDHLELELMEQTMVADPERSVQLLSRLKEIGVGVAIDNFGTTGFSLSQLKKFPISVLKVDPHFVRDSANTPSKSLVSGIISMAHALNMRVVGKGIEKDTELNLLRSSKCDCYQGNLFSPPIANKALEDILRKHMAKPVTKAKKVDEAMPWPVTAAPVEEVKPTPKPVARKHPESEQLPWPVSAAVAESVEMTPITAPPPAPVQRTSSATLMMPRNLDRIPDARKYMITCYNCRNKYDAMETTWCSCLTSERTFICPSCLKCFCRASLEYKIDFWAEAPRSMWDRRVKEEAEFSTIKMNPAPEEVKRPLVLIVDDEIPILSMAASAVERLGFGVVTGINGEEALELAKQYRPQVILSDALMPRMDGREMCRLLKQDPVLQKIKVIIMSSLYYSGKQRSGAFREFRIDEYLQKPVDFYVLKSLLEKFLT